MLSAEEKAKCLVKGVFGGLTEASRQAVAERMGERELEDGQYLFMQGEPGHEVFFVIDGAVEILRNDRVITVLGAGELIGEMAVLGAGWRTASGRSKGRARLLFLKEKALKLLIQKVPDLAFAVFGVLIDRLQETNDLAFFLAGDRKVLGEVEITAGDAAGKVVPIHHRSQTLGCSRGNMLANGLRVIIPSDDPALLEEHARITLEEDGIYLEPLEGTISLGGEAIEERLGLTQEDEVQIGDLRLCFRLTASE